MLQRIALLAIAAPRRILVVALLVMVACGIAAVFAPWACALAATNKASVVVRSSS